MNDLLQFLIDVCQIQELFLYCYLFLLVDWVFEFDVEVKWILVQKNVSINELFFQGYFLGCLIMFGVLIIEVLVQVGGVMMQLMFGCDVQFKLFYMVKVENVCFNKQVVFGDVLMLDVQMKCLICNMGWYYGEVKVNGEVVVLVEVMCVGVKG